ncbi:MAG TPA: protein kinase [Pyrinomonadaceae bacterium]|nr:protein kinase [Pyrinomonadaceae bacterium]
MSNELSANSTLSHYRIVSKIGAGGMGEVYLAEDTRLNRKVALKVLPSDVAANQERMRRFVQEAKAASALNHPNIAHIYEIGEAGGIHFIAMEFVEGATLREKIHGDKADLKTLLKYLAQVADGLAKAHAAGIVHRDLKPDNIMVTPDGFAKILDFGLAKLVEAQKPPGAANSEEINEAATAMLSPQPLSTPGMIMGTVGYMSPEQAQGRQDVDQRSDIFSFGCVLFEAATRRQPFAGDSVIDTLHRIIKQNAPPVRDFNPEAPAELQRIVRRCLQKDPEERFQSIKDVAIELKELRREMRATDNELDYSVAPQSPPKSTISGDENATAILSADGGTANQSAASRTDEAGAIRSTSSAEYIVGEVKKHKLGVALAALMLLALLGVGGWFFLFRSSTANAPIDSIAVLPFQNRSADTDTEYLSDGLAESLIYRLSQLPNLKVSPTSSVFRYKGKETDVQKIANELGVQAVMTGRISQRGDNLTISVELVDTRTGKLLWGEQYERKMSDLLATQREIATAIAEKLQLKLSGEDAKGLTKKYTESNEAYQLYLKGRFQWNKRTGESLKQAAEVYKQAIEQDPGFALAYSGLAETYVLFSNYDVASSLDSMPQAKAAALRALELDESLAEAHTALGWYYEVFEWNWANAEKELRRAIELNPNYATAHQWLGEHLVHMKRFDEGLAEIKRAQELDPLSPIIASNDGWLNLLARRYDESIAASNRALSLHPNFGLAYSQLCSAYNAKGMKETIAACRKAREVHNDAYNTGFLALVLGRAGQRDEARRLLDELKAESARRYVPSYAIAIAHLGLNEKEEALAWLEREIAERGYWATTYAVAPELDDLRSDPRFKAMLKRLNLPE